MASNQATVLFAVCSGPPTHTLPGDVSTVWCLHDKTSLVVTDWFRRTKPASYSAVIAILHAGTGQPDSSQVRVRVVAEKQGYHASFPRL